MKKANMIKANDEPFAIWFFSNRLCIISGSTLKRKYIPEELYHRWSAGGMMGDLNPDEWLSL